MNFNQKVALITGGSSGIGLAVARRLAAQDARVFIVGRDEERLAQAAAAFSAGSAPPQLLAADVSDPDQAQRVVSQVIESAGRIDLLINCAGVVRPGYVQSLSLEQFHWMMDINYFGTVYTTKAALPCLMDQCAGVIVNVGSVASRISVIGYSAYSGSKFAVRGFTDALRLELKAYGIQVHLVYPPDTDTPGLAEENLHKPPELKYLLPELGVVSAEAVAAAILSSIRRGRYEITSDFGSRLLLYLEGAVGSRRYHVLDLLLARARKRAAAENNGS
ncbi:MAG: SDR family oxidoreductase [Chloroflexota bacterium]